MRITEHELVWQRSEGYVLFENIPIPEATLFPFRYHSGSAAAFEVLIKIYSGCKGKMETSISTKLLIEIEVSVMGAINLKCIHLHEGIIYI